MSEKMTAIASGYCPICSWLNHPDGPSYKVHPDGICRAFPALVNVDWNSYGRLGGADDEHFVSTASRPLIVGETVLCISDWDETGEYDGAMASWGVVTEVLPSGSAVVKHRSETGIFDDGRDQGIAYSRRA